jgi:hypothetical protein
MKRRPLNVVTALSLLLCVAAIVEWARSGFAGDELNVYDQRAGASRSVSTSLRFASGRGLMSLAVRQRRSPRPVPPGAASIAQRTWRWQPLQATGIHFARGTFWQRLGFAFQAERQRGFYRHPDVSGPYHQLDVAVRVPYWAIASVSGVIAALGIRSRRRAIAARARRGLCPACGYDLRATPGQCPECGHGSAGATA